jgi:hypothetical protein
MRILQLLLGTVVLLVPVGVNAFNAPVRIEPESASMVVPLTYREGYTMFYGTLNGFPHTFEIRVQEDMPFHAELLIPDIDSSEETITGIIIKETGRQGRVAEVARLLPKDASWESEYDWRSAQSYRQGSVYDGVLTPGVYRIEVSTPDNDAQYVLMLGNTHTLFESGYFDRISALLEMKEFFGFTRLSILFTPYVGVPLLSILALLFVYRVRRRKVAES